MKFKFSLEAVLKNAIQQEGEAKRSFFQARNKLDQCLGQIQTHFDQIRMARDKIAREEQGRERGAVDRITQLQSYIFGLEIKIKQERLKARDLMMDVEAKQETLVEASKERKTLDVLKERKYQEYRQTLKKREGRELDDIVVMRSGRGRI